MKQSFSQNTKNALLLNVLKNKENMKSSFPLIKNSREVISFQSVFTTDK
jgi:hypothetical protein